RLHHAHLAPVGLHLVGDDHGHASANALAHFRAVAHDADDAVAVDGDEHQRVVDPAVGHAVGAELLGIGGARSRHETGSNREGAERRGVPHEAAAADVDDDERIVAANSIEWRAHAFAPV